MTSPESPVPTDEQLAQFCAQRGKAGEDAFLELYRRHGRPLLAFLATRVRREALEDVHQTVWLRVWERTPDQFAGGNFRAWLFRIARNHLIDLGRRRHADPAEAPEEWQDTRTPAGADALIAREEPHLVRKCMERLGVDEALVVRERLAGESYEDICGRLKIDRNKAYKLYYEALKTLQSCVERATR